MDCHNKEIIKVDDVAMKKKKKILAGTRWKLKRNHTFNYVSQHTGKGIRQKLWHLHVPAKDGNVKTTLVKREEIEKQISMCNKKHLKQAHNSITYEDKTCHWLKDDSIRDKILNRTLTCEDCDDKRAYCLLKLLCQNEKDQHNRS